jgi:hypothetical protein
VITCSFCGREYESGTAWAICLDSHREAQKIRWSLAQEPDRWAAASTNSILQAAQSFARKVLMEHRETNPTCACRRCAEAAHVMATLRVVMEAIDKVLKPDA